MAKRIGSNTGIAVFLNGHLLTPHAGNKIEEKDHRESVTYALYYTDIFGKEGKDSVSFSYTNRYALKFGDGGDPIGIAFTEPLECEDTISLLDSGKWGVNVVHYEVGDDELGQREVVFDKTSIEEVPK